MRAERILAAGVLFWVVELACAAVVGGVRDPGVRGGPSGAGTALAGADVVYFAEASAAFREVHSILGSLGPAPGLGPRFNGTSCGGFHAQPAPGGSSPRRNPQFVMAAAHGGRNKIPSFLAPDGPVRVARDKVKPDGALVRLFTISGRSDAGNCVVAQPDFSDGENLCVRIPTPAFGAGLIENIPESAIRADQAAEAHTKRELGIFGKPNINADGAIGRFGWKAQHASLLHFSGEVYQIEMAVPNEVFYPQQESLPEICLSLYQDVRTTTLPTITNYTDSYSGRLESPVYLFTNFMRLLDQPKPVTSFPGASAESITKGRQLFERAGCALCHTPALRTGQFSPLPAMNHADGHLYSDLLLHHMGSRLCGRHCTGRGWTGRVSHGAAVGTWRARVLSARRQNVGPPRDDRGAQEQRKRPHLRSQCGG